MKLNQDRTFVFKLENHSLRVKKAHLNSWVVFPLPSQIIDVWIGVNYALGLSQRSITIFSFPKMSKLYQLGDSTFSLAYECQGVVFIVSKQLKLVSFHHQKNSEPSKRVFSFDLEKKLHACDGLSVQYFKQIYYVVLRTGISNFIILQLVKGVGLQMSKEVVPNFEDQSILAVTTLSGEELSVRSNSQESWIEFKFMKFRLDELHRGETQFNNLIPFQNKKGVFVIFSNDQLHFKYSFDSQFSLDLAVFKNEEEMLGKLDQFQTLNYIDQESGMVLKSRALQVFRSVKPQIDFYSQIADLQQKSQKGLLDQLDRHLEREHINQFVKRGIVAIQDGWKRVSRMLDFFNIVIKRDNKTTKSIIKIFQGKQQQLAQKLISIIAKKPRAKFQFRGIVFWLSEDLSTVLDKANIMEHCYYEKQLLLVQVIKHSLTQIQPFFYTMGWRYLEERYMPFVNLEELVSLNGSIQTIKAELWKVMHSPALRNPLIAESTLMLLSLLDDVQPALSLITSGQIPLREMNNRVLTDVHLVLLRPYQCYFLLKQCGMSCNYLLQRLVEQKGLKQCFQIKKTAEESRFVEQLVKEHWKKYEQFLKYSAVMQ